MIQNPQNFETQFYSNLFGHNRRDLAHNRGIQVYNLYEIIGQTGRSKDGDILTWGQQMPYYFISIRQRNDIFKVSIPVLGIVSSRMQRISAQDFDIVSKEKVEDEIVEGFKSAKRIFDDYAGEMDIKYLTVRANIFKELQRELPELLPTMKNFDNSLLRWKQVVKSQNKKQTNEIKDWLMQPNIGVSWEDYIKKYVFNLMIHGANATYKDVENGRIENFDNLIGGTVYPLTKHYVSNIESYIQMGGGFENQIFFSNELSYTSYLPISSQSYPVIPLEALINRVSEDLLYGRKMAEEADGTKAPSKAVIITNNEQLGLDVDGQQKEVPLDKGEQKRIESKLNIPVKEGIVTLSGNKAVVLDLSRADELSIRSQRSKDIREDVAIVFNMSSMEINNSGSEGTSGRSTSEAQGDIEEGKGGKPIKKIIANDVTRNILPFRYGSGYMMKYAAGKNPMEEIDIVLKKQQAGIETINESRENDGKSTFPEPEFDRPQSGRQEAPDGSELNPLSVKQLENK